MVWLRPPAYRADCDCGTVNRSDEGTRLMQRAEQHPIPSASGSVDTYARTRMARSSIGRTVSDHGAGQIDMIALRAYRLQRLQAELRQREIPAILLSDPVNIRYATGVRNMQPWSLHSTYRTAFVPAEGRAILFEYAGSEHLASELETVAEVRPAVSRFWAGEPAGTDGHDDRKVRLWAAEIADILRKHGGMLLAIDRHIDHFSARSEEQPYETPSLMR